MMNPSRIAAALQRQCLAFFLVPVFATLHPGAPPLRLLWYLFAMCHALERAVDGDRQRLVISLPPRYLKSITASVALVAWLLGRDPALKIMVATYSAELAREHAQACRTIMESTWYQRLFPNTRLSQRTNRQLDFRTTAGGGRRAVSVTGSTTGLGADVIILDDCMKADEITSEAARAEVKRWYANTLLTRLNSKRTGTIISIQQRLGEDDLTASLLDRGFEHLCLPAIAERDEHIPIGFGRAYPRTVGEVLDPEREDIATLEALRRELGPVVFSAQYQQNPVAPEGNIIRVEKFPRYEWPMERSDFQKVVQSWDTGMSASPDSDWSVCLTCGYRDDRWYLLDVFRRQLDYPDLRNAVLRLARQWSADKVVIEDAGSGKSLWQELHRFKGVLRPLMWPATIGKEERLIGQLGQIEDGRLLLPDDAPWLDAFLSELRAFPTGRNDDQVDAMSQFLEFAMSRQAWVNTPIDPVTGRRLHIRRRETVRRSSVGTLAD